MILCTSCEIKAPKGRDSAWSAGGEQQQEARFGVKEIRNNDDFIRVPPLQ